LSIILFLHLIFYYSKNENVDTPGEGTVCVWLVLLRENRTLSLNVIFEQNIEGLLK